MSAITKFLKLFIPDITDNGTIITDVIDPAFRKIDQNAEKSDQAINELKIRLDRLNICPYNVGDIYITTNNTNPSTIWLGTTWQKIEGRYLKSTSGSEASKQTAGRNTVQLLVENMPSHIHTANTASHSHSQQSHTHTEGVSGRGYSGSVGTGDAADGLSHAWREGQFSRVYIQTKPAGGENTGSASPVTSIGSTGGGRPFDIQPPYYTAHVWLRKS